MLLTGVAGFLLALPSLRLRGHYLAMATLGFNEIMTVLFVELRGITGGNDGLSGIGFPRVGSLALDSPGQIFALVWIILILVVVLASNLVSFRPGRAMRALHASEHGAQACGIDTTSVKVSVFTASAAIAGLAGSLYAHAVGFISPTTFSLEFSILLVAMVVVGGTRSLGGPLVACAFLTLLPYVDALMPGLTRGTVELLQQWEADITGLAMILVLLFAPGGLRSLAAFASSLVVKRGRR